MSAVRWATADNKAGRGNKVPRPFSYAQEVQPISHIEPFELKGEWRRDCERKPEIVARDIRYHQRYRGLLA